MTTQDRETRPLVSTSHSTPTPFQNDLVTNCQKRFTNPHQVACSICLLTFFCLCSPSLRSFSLTNTSSDGPTSSLPGPPCSNPQFTSRNLLLMLAHASCNLRFHGSLNASQPPRIPKPPPEIINALCFKRHIHIHIFICMCELHSGPTHPQNSDCAAKVFLLLERGESAVPPYHVSLSLGPLLVKRFVLGIPAH